ncbi:MAG: phosphatase PAP2 family protein, partial [Roseiflexaceae bacterium]
RLQARAWLLRDPAGLAAQLDPSLALAELTTRAVAVPSAPRTSTVDLAVAAVLTGTVHTEAQAPMPPPQPVVLPAAGTPAAAPALIVAPAALIPAPAASAAQAAWAQPIPAWTELAMDAIQRSQRTSNRAARDLAILSVAFNDSFFVLDAARAQKAEVSEDALLAAVARQTLTALYPSDDHRWQQSYAVAVWMGAWHTRASAQSVANGVQLGEIVADAVQARMDTDGASAPQTFDWPESMIPPGQTILAPPVDRWRPTLPEHPIDPLWGKVQLIGLPSAKGLTAAAPPNWDAEAFVATRMAFAATQHTLTDTQRATVQQWAAHPGIAPIASLWFRIAQMFVSDAHLDNRATANVYAALGVTVHNASVVSWADAYAYRVPRPTAWMRAHDSAWSPLVQAPSIPSYPSDDAVTSYAVADVLIAFFPAQTPQITATAVAAARAQVYAGVHWQLDTDAGADQGRRVGQAMLALMRSSKASVNRFV